MVSVVKVLGLPVPVVVKYCSLPAGPLYSDILTVKVALEVKFVKVTLFPEPLYTQ